MNTYRIYYTITGHSPASYFNDVPAASEEDARVVFKNNRSGSHVIKSVELIPSPPSAPEKVQ